MDKQPQTEGTTHEGSLAGPVDGVIRNPGRRRFGRAAGLGGSGVLLTLACKPVLGAVVCKTPSGFLSGNQSTHGASALCNGRNAQYWSATSSWPVSKKTKFPKVFNAGPGSALEQATLAEVVAGHTADPDKVAMHLTTALLNSRSGWTPFLTEEMLQGMFLEWRTKGFYTPTVNVQWTGADIVNYLKATQA